MTQMLVKTGLTTFVALVHAAAAAAQHMVLTYKTEKVADGVYAFITPEERSGFQSGNSIAIIGDNGVLVFDTGNIPSSTRRQIAEIRKLTEQARPLRGEQPLAPRPQPRQLGISSRISERRVHRHVGDATGHSRTSADVLRPDDIVPADRLVAARGPRSRHAARWAADSRGTLASHGDSSRATTRSSCRRCSPDEPLAPDLVFDDSLTIDLGHRVVKVVRPGRGNTAGDAYVFLPDSKTLLTGDLLTMPCPFPGTSFISEWIARSVSSSRDTRSRSCRGMATFSATTRTRARA